MLATARVRASGLRAKLRTTPTGKGVLAFAPAAFRSMNDTVLLVLATATHQGPGAVGQGLVATAATGAVGTSAAAACRAIDQTFRLFASGGTVRTRSLSAAKEIHL